MLRFCLAGRYPLDVSKIGGGPQHVMHILSGTFAERHDIDFHVVALIESQAFSDVVEQDGAVIHRVGVPRNRLIPNLLAAGSRLAPVFRALEPDIVNSHDTSTTDGALRAGCKVVHTIHGISAKEIPYVDRRQRLAARLHHRTDCGLISRSSGVLSVAQYGLDCFDGCVKAPSCVIGVPIEDGFFDVGEMSPDKGILFAGSIRKRKNPLALLRAMPGVLAKHRDARLYLCGSPGEPDYAAEVKAFISEHGLGSAIELPGVVDRETLCAYLAKSRCLALPSYQETAPGVICQAMAAGRPVVASPVGGVPEMIEDGATGFLVDADDSEALADRLIQLMDDTDLARDMGSAARKIARERYDRHKVADRILEICSSLAQ
jgi:glycosyltransferase involved in cell wall biosynthesis